MIDNMYAGLPFNSSKAAQLLKKINTDASDLPYKMMYDVIFRKWMGDKDICEEFLMAVTRLPVHI